MSESVAELARQLGSPGRTFCWTAPLRGLLLLTRPLVRLLSAALAIVLAGAGLVVVGASAQAAPLDAWASPQTLGSSPPAQGNAYVTVSSDGKTALAIWQSGIGSSGTSVQTRVASISGNSTTWGSTTPIPATALNNLAAAPPRVSISADGTRAVAIWTNQGVTGAVATTSVGSISGTSVNWGPESAISAAQAIVTFPQIVLSSDGTRATAIWNQANGVRSNSAVIAADGSAIWASNAVNNVVGATVSSLPPSLALSADGTTAVVVWVGSSPFPAQLKSTQVNGTSAVWPSTATQLSAASSNTVPPKAALSADGTVAFAVFADKPASVTNIKGARIAIAGDQATITASALLSDGSVNTLAPQVALTSDGSVATAIWLRNAGTGAVTVQSRTMPTTLADLGTTAQLDTGASTTSGPTVRISTSGSRAAAAWTSQDPSSSNVVPRAASGTITGGTASWNTPQTLADAATASGVQLGASGDGATATAVWLLTSGGSTSIHASSGVFYVPPQITSIDTGTGNGGVGTQVIINGLYLTGTTSVTFGGTPAEFTVLSDTQIQAVVPPHVGGPVGISVTNPVGSATLEGAFSYPPEPPGPLPDVTLVQKPINKCVLVPRSIPAEGKKKIMKRGCKTNADERVRVRVTGHLRGDLRLFEVRRNKRGTFLITNGFPLRLRIVWSAPGIGDYAAYSKVERYRT